MLYANFLCVDLGLTKLVATPTETDQAQVDSNAAAGYTNFKFLISDETSKAVKIGTLGMGQRRVTVLWPSWFEGKSGEDTITLPPYYLAAVVAGMDSGLSPSQDFTNYDTGIPGISNIKLNTNYYFTKRQLDEIGGGGVDVLIQSSQISSLIKSRDDLTSDNSSIEFSARSVTKQADVAAKTIRNAVAPYLGKYNITNNLLMFLGQICSIVATTLTKQDGVLSGFDIVSITRSEQVVNKVDFNVRATVFIAGKHFDITMLVVS